MRRQLDSSLSITGFLILASLVAIVFAGCGEKKPQVNRPDTQPRGCGFAFEL